MRLLHTSDWHLGHTLYDVSREAEHAAFLSWLLDTLEAQSVDALLISGDIFDTANPSAEAQAACRQRRHAAHRIFQREHLALADVQAEHAPIL